MTRTIRAGGNADLEAGTIDWQQDHKARATDGLARLRSSDFCGGCHQQFVPGTAVPAIGTFDEWKASPFAATASCVDCHMRKGDGVADHRVVGGNVYLAEHFGAADMADSLRAQLRSALGLTASTDASGRVNVEIENLLVGHSFPTGVTDIREAWVELDAVDAEGKTVSAIGGPGTDGLLPADAARLGADIAKADGTLLFSHELSVTTRIPFERRIPPKASVTVSFPAPPPLPAGATELDAVLYYQNVRTQYYRAATGDASGSAPATELARVKVR